MGKTAKDITIDSAIEAMHEGYVQIVAAGLLLKGIGANEDAAALRNVRQAIKVVEERIAARRK